MNLGIPRQKSVLSPLLSEWSTPVQISSGGTSFAVATRNNWAYTVWDILHSNIFLARSADGGQNWNPIHERVTAYDYEDPETPAIVVDPNSGTIYMVYLLSQGENTETTLEGVRSTDNGQTWSNWSPPVFIPLNTLPNVAIDNSSNLYLSWTTAEGETKLTRSTNSGQTWSPEFTVENNLNCAILTRSNWIAATGNGVVYIVWVCGQQVRVTKSVDGGQTWVDKPALRDNPDVGFGYPTIALDGPDKVYVAWREALLTSDTFFATSQDGGDTWSTPVGIGSAFAGGPLDIGARGSGQVVLGWKGDNALHIAESNNHGQQWTTETLAASVDTFALDADPATGAAVVAWMNLSGQIFATSSGGSASPLTLDILDPQGNPVTDLTLNSDGWPTPNPLTVTVTLNCLSDTVGACSNSLDFDLGASSQAARFYVYEADLSDNQTCQISPVDFYARFSFQEYNMFCAPVSLLPGETITFHWRVWIQPSEAATFNVSAVWGNGIGNKSVSIPQSEIHPVVFLHGILGSMPPGDGLVTKWPQGLTNTPPGESHLDPWIGSYKPIIDTFLKMGYELNETLFPVTYDWRQSNKLSASHLRSILGNQVQNNAPAYIVRTASNKVQADVVGHSMGGLVLRSYLEDLAADDDGYQEDINKAITIATPHQGFPVTYNTYEGLTWENYFSDEIAFRTDYIGASIPFVGGKGKALSIVMDNLVWPYFILERYNPDSDEACSNPFREVKAVQLINSLNPFCSHEILYAYSHDNIRGIHSLPQMLTPGSISYLMGDNNSTTSNNLLEGSNGLNSVNNLPKLKRLGNPDTYDNIYVIYNNAQLTPLSFEVFDPSSEGDWYAWPHGKPQITKYVEPDEQHYRREGDGLIPTYSTKLGNLISLVDVDNQELSINPPFNENQFSGHVLIMVEPQTQSAIGAILTGIGGNPVDVKNTQSFPIYTPYDPPVLGFDNFSTVIAYVFWSPVDGMITDPLGRRVGYNPVTNQRINEIPGAFYSGPGEGEEFILIPGGLDGQYQVTTFGTANGDFAVSGHVVDTVGAQFFDVVTGTISAGQVMTQTMVYSPDLQLIFADDMESGGGNWTVDNPGTVGTWALTTTITGTADTYSPPTAWRVGGTNIITPGEALTLTLNIPLDLSQARRARLTFWYSATLSSQTIGMVEGSLDDGQNWFTLAQQPTTLLQTISGTTVLSDPLQLNAGWNRRVIDLSPFTGPEQNPLRLRFKLTPHTVTDRWWLDDVRVEAVVVPSLFAFPFEDDVEGLRYWDSNGAWARTSQQAHNDQWAWQSGQSGDILTLAGDIVMPQGITPTLTFWQMVSPTIEGGVELSTNSGASWAPVYTVTTANSGWSKVQVTLDSAAGLTTTLRFHQQAGPTAGWLIDDISVDQIVSPTNVISVFLESGGQVVMEAEHFSRHITRSNHLWLPQTNLAGYVGEAYLRANPDLDWQAGDSYTSTSSELQLTFQTSLTGTYYLWIRGYAPNGAGDSVYIGLDGQPANSSQLTGFAPRDWSWAGETMAGTLATLEIDQSGLHTLHLWLREDGLAIDRLLLTTNAASTPTGDGPPESNFNLMLLEP